MRLLSYFLILLAGCGMHVTSDPIQVRHEVHISIEGIIEHCQRVCGGDTYCENRCMNKLVELLSDPQICVDLNSCL